jgi:hypothetical protein
MCMYGVGSGRLYERNEFANKWGDGDDGIGEKLHAGGNDEKQIRGYNIIYIYIYMYT